MNSRVGVEREKALLPATMAVVESRKEIKSMEEEVKQIDIQIRQLQGRKWALRQQIAAGGSVVNAKADTCLLYTSPSPRDQRGSRMPSSA